MRTKRKNKKKINSLLIAAMICSLQVFAQESDSIYYSFQRTDTSYTFYGRFNVDAEVACVLHIFFNYEHIKELAANDCDVELIEEGENWNRFKYTYRVFPLYKNESLWYRTIDNKNQRVDFKLVLSKNNRTYIPQMISSSGYYQVSQNNGELTMEYFRYCRLTKSFLTPLYLYFIKNKAIAFLPVFEDYIEKQCNRID